MLEKNKKKKEKIEHSVVLLLFLFTGNPYG